MALRAGSGGVGTDEGEASGGVVEGGISPSSCVVALGAERSGEASGDVIGHIATESLRAVPIGLMAAVAIGIGGSQAVIVIDMALCARSGGMCASESETGDAMIERGGIPADSGMAIGAIGGSEGGT